MTVHKAPHQDVPFAGFYDVESISIPSRFFTEVLPEITRLDELQVTLGVFRMLAEGDGYEAPLAEQRILSDRALARSFRIDGISTGDVRQAIHEALERSVSRGTVLRVESRSGSKTSAWYFLHTPVTRELVHAINRGAIAPPRVMWTEDSAPEITMDPPTPFFLYEQNIGPLTPLVADRISRAMDDYSTAWIEDAIGEAVAYNRRSWKYVERILESWLQHGRPDNSH